MSVSRLSYRLVVLETKVLVSSALEFGFKSLGLGLGLENKSLGLGLGLENKSLGLDLGLEVQSLGHGFSRPRPRPAFTALQY